MKQTKIISLAMVVAFVVGTPMRAQQSAVLDKVNLYMGTADDYGQMAPGATVPYSQIQVCPDSKPRQHPGYDFEQPTISGFSINRLSGVGGSGCGGNVSLMPDARIWVQSSPTPRAGLSTAFRYSPPRVRSHLHLETPPAQSYWRYIPTPRLRSPQRSAV